MGYSTKNFLNDLFGKQGLFGYGKRGGVGVFLKGLKSIGSTKKIISRPKYQNIELKEFLPRFKAKVPWEQLHEGAKKTLGSPRLSPGKHQTTKQSSRSLTIPYKKRQTSRSPIVAGRAKHRI